VFYYEPATFGAETREEEKEKNKDFSSSVVVNFGGSDYGVFSSTRRNEDTLHEENTLAETPPRPRIVSV
jgi:hypothetical protein